MITSPYNFVPLSNKIVTPFWAKHISQDIPFKDAKSGKLRLSIKGESPIYVRNGMPRNAHDNNPAKNDFNNVDKRYFIPGSSVKGMLRSVVEIMSFGRMANKVNDHRYSVRDFQNNDIYPKTNLSNKVECGWLYKEGDDYFIDKCGKPGRISHKNLDAFCNGDKISTYYKKSSNVKTDKDKSAKSKNEKFDFGETEEYFKLDYDNNGRKVYKVDSDGKIGTIVMTGQSGVRKESKNGDASGKHLGFIFWEAKEKAVPVDQNVVENFLFAYYDHDTTQQKEDWKWRKKQLNNQEKIPIFFRTDKNGRFIDMGLTMLYKIAYKNSIKELITAHQGNSEDYDLAEAIFGYVGDQEALKGRVHIGHAFAKKDSVTELKEQNEVLSGPKASYYPNYVVQKEQRGKINGKYQNYMDKNAKIRGWKRYPVRQNGNTISNKGTANVSTQFKPLDKGAVFSFDIAYHNLREEELGALLSAITFHQTEGLFHSIGSAKPLGYGKIKLSIEDGLSQEEQEEALRAYETFMDYGLGNSTPLWFQSNQLKELFAMAKPGSDDSKLDYMELKKFANKKKKRESLQDYSSINKNIFEIKSLTSSTVIENAREEYEQEKSVFNNLKQVSALKEERQEEERKRMENVLSKLKTQLLQDLEYKKGKGLRQEVALLENSDNIKALETFIAKYPVHEKVSEFQQRLTELYIKQKEEEAAKMGEKEMDLKGKSFKEAQNYLEAFYEDNKRFEFSEAQKKQIEEYVNWCYENEPNVFYKKKKAKKFKKHPWSLIRKWLNIPRAANIYNSLIKS